jgi:hypothetical protein
MRDRDGMTAHEAASEVIDRLELRVRWLTEEVADLRAVGDALQAMADRYMGDTADGVDLVAAIEDWSETRETYDNE